MKKIHKIQVGITGLRPIMFDRYPGDNKTALKPEDKMYFGEDGQTVVLPSLNIISFLSAQNTTSAPKRLLNPKEYKKVCNALLSYVSIDPYLIPIKRNGKPIIFDGFDDKVFSIHRSVARLDKGIPNPKERPMIGTPWELDFEMTMFDNDDVSTKALQILFEQGGLALGFGTFRGVFGKFEVTNWTVKTV
jgi:hypothetical protein